MLIPADKQAVTLAERVLLHCPVEGADPPPVIHWTKEGIPVEIGDRIQQLGNGSLVIYDSNVSGFAMIQHGADWGGGGARD